MLVDDSLPQRKVGSDPISIRTSSPVSPSCPGMMPFEIELRRTLSRVDELSLSSSPNHRHQRQKRFQSQHSKNTASSSKLTIGRISNFLRGRDSNFDTSFINVFDPASCSISEVTSGEYAPAQIQESSSWIKHSRSRGTVATSRPGESNRCNKTYPSLITASREPSTRVYSRPTDQVSKKYFYPDVFVPPPPLENMPSAVYAEFKSDSEVLLSSTMFDLSSGSTRACNQTLRISVSPKKTRTPQTPTKLPVAPWLNESPSASSVSGAMRAMGISMHDASPNLDLLEDDEGSDTSTVHLFEMAHSAHSYSIDAATEEEARSMPPKLTVSTSTSSATAFIKEIPTCMPILCSQTTSSTIRTIQWTSYEKYYEPDDAMRSRPDSIQRSVSDLSQPTTDSNKKPSALPRVNHGPTLPQTLEVAPGHFVSLRGANETLMYAAADATSPRRMIITQTCIACDTAIHSVCDCEYILCPVCHTILSSGVQGHGVGLGFLTKDWDEWNFNLLQAETALDCSPFARMPSAS